LAGRALLVAGSVFASMIRYHTETTLYAHVSGINRRSNTFLIDTNVTHLSLADASAFPLIGPLRLYDQT
jgi:hypothetical protein